MRRLSALLLTALTALAPLTRAEMVTPLPTPSNPVAPAQPSTSPAASVPASGEPAFAQTIRDWMAKDDGPPGVALIVRQKGQTTFHYFGLADREGEVPMSADSVFELASISKVFTTTLLALAVDRGEVSLDDPVVRYLPELHAAPDSDIAKLTLRQLATHTSGLPRTPGAQPWHQSGRSYTQGEFYRFLREWHAERVPGTRYEYSNIGVGLIGLALEARALKSFTALLASEIFGPLDLISTGIRLPSGRRKYYVQGYGLKNQPVPRTAPNAWPGSGGLRASVHDMARFLEANLGEGDVPAPLYTAMQHAQTGVFKVTSKFTQALGWQVIDADGATLVDKNGALTGSSTYIGLVPAQHLGLVILANRSQQPVTALGRKILLELAQAPAQPLPAAPEPDPGATY